MIRFEIRKSKWRQKYWVSIVHKNGNVLFHSENYSRKEDALQAANDVQMYAFNAYVFVIA